jgi:hypothetical protein
MPLGGGIRLLLLVATCRLAGADESSRNTPATAPAAPPRRPPVISDHEEHTLTAAFQCPACAAVFWELDHALWSAETNARVRGAAKVAANAPLAEHEYLEVLAVRAAVRAP